MLHLVDFPDDVIDMIMCHIFAHRARWRFALCCKATLESHTRTPRSTLRCSMRWLTQRSRYEEVPHWSADVVALLRAISNRPSFRQVKHLILAIDAPCFETDSSPWHHPEMQTLLKSHNGKALESITVCTRRGEFPKPSPRAIAHLLHRFAELNAITLMDIKNLGHGAMTTVLDHRRLSLRHLCLQNCGLTDAARRVTLLKLAGFFAEDVQPAFVRKPWPKLYSLTLTGPGFKNVLRDVHRILGDVPLNLPSSLRILDMHDNIDALTTMQLLLTITWLHKLEELVLVMTKPRVLQTINAYRADVYPQLRIRYQI